jgi:putative ABC transport system substrate-binding protein
MIPIRVLALAALLSVSVAAPVIAQPALPRIGVLASSTQEAAKPYLDAFKHRLHELGFVEGQGVRYLQRYADNDMHKLRRLTDELVAEGVSVLYAPATPEALAAKEATRTIPIVFSNVNDPVIVKLVGSYARPGGNVTGIALDTNALGAKRLQFLKELVPGAERMALLFDKDYADACRLELDQIRASAKELKVNLELVPFEGSATLDGALARVRQARPQALMSPVSGTFAIDAVKIGSFIQEQRIPALIEPLEAAQHGAILSYGPDNVWASRRAAEYVARILKGTKPADLPVERPTRYDLVINLKAAKALGIKVPATLLLQATRVIE